MRFTLEKRKTLLMVYALFSHCPINQSKMHSKKNWRRQLEWERACPRNDCDSRRSKLFKNLIVFRVCCSVRLHYITIQTVQMSFFCISKMKRVILYCPNFTLLTASSLLACFYSNQMNVSHYFQEHKSQK